MQPAISTTRRLRPPKKAAGFTLIEVGIAAVLVAMLTSGALLFAADELRTSEAKAAGLALTTLNTAVSGYEAQFASNLANHTAVPIPGHGNVANPYSPTTTELVQLGFLKTAVPPGVYGIAINPTVTAGTPSGMVWIIQPFTDYMGRPSQDLAAAATISAGGDAAFSTVGSPSVVAGVDGWTATNPQTNTAGVVAMRNGAGSAAFLRLDGSTPMEGNLSMNGYSINNANTVGAGSVTASGNITAGGSVTGNNVAAANAVTAQNYITAGNYVSSNGNIYAGQNISANGNTSGSTLTATAWGNDVYFGTSALYSDGWNSVIRNTGGALYVQNFGGGLEPTVTSQVITPGGNGVQVGSSYYYGDGWNSAVRQNGAFYIQNPDGSQLQNGIAADVWIAAAGKWASQMGGENNNYVSIDIGNGGVFYLPGGTKRVDGYVDVTWTGSNAGVAEFIVRDNYGNIQNYFFGGDNGWNDGGSGSRWWFPVSIPVVSNSASIQMVQIDGSNSLVWHIGNYSN